MEPERIIANFLRPPSEGGAYTDEKLAALLAHAEDGKLSFHSCCCFAGVPSALHALQGEHPGKVDCNFNAGHSPAVDVPWMQMSAAFCGLADTDAERRAKLIPLIRSEMQRRESLRSQTEVSEVVMV